MANPNNSKLITRFPILIKKIDHHQNEHPEVLLMYDVAICLYDGIFSQSPGVVYYWDQIQNGAEKSNFKDFLQNTKNFLKKFNELETKYEAFQAVRYYKVFGYKYYKEYVSQIDDTYESMQKYHQILINTGIIDKCRNNKLSERDMSKFQKEMNKKDKDKDKNKTKDKGTAPPKNSKNSEKLKKSIDKDLEKRTILENKILVLIGGKTGIQAAWEELKNAAEDGNINIFGFFARSFPDRVQKLQDYYEELKKIRQKKEYKDFVDQYENAKLVLNDYVYESNCEKILKNNDYLIESGILEKIKNTDFSQEELIEWAKNIPCI